MTGQADTSPPNACDQASPWPHRLALLVFVLSLPLLFLGGRVTSTGSGMAVPDWPSTYGENLFLFPFSKWVGAVGIEHTHRVAGGIVGLATLVFALVAFREGGRGGSAPGLRWQGPLALGIVIAQGVLGGLRVTQYDQRLAPIHGCLAQAFCGYMAALVTITSPRWRATAPAGNGPSRLAGVGLGLAALSYVQVVLGAWYRHVGQTSGARIEPHALLAFGILALLIVAGVRLKRSGLDAPLSRRSLKRFHGALGVQLLLGIAALVLRYVEAPVDLKVVVVSSHIVAAALVVGASVAFALSLSRETRQGTGPASRASAAESEASASAAKQPVAGGVA